MNKKPDSLRVFDVILVLALIGFATSLITLGYLFAETF